MSKFNVTPRKAVDPAKLAAFTAGAENHQPVADLAAPAAQLSKEPVTLSAAPMPAAPAAARQSESLLFRLTKSELDDFNFVYENTNIKSKQKLLELLILPEIARRAKEIRGGN